ncbi:hypothetical protein HF519_05030, partial [Pseudonocardia bannensis]
MAGLGGVLSKLLELAGASYVCVVERDSARILGDVGGNDGHAVDINSVIALATSAAEIADAPGEGPVEDLILSSRRCYHVLRPVDVPAGPTLLLYIRLQRGRATLALARRELGTAEIQRAVLDLARGRSDRGDVSAAARDTGAAAAAAPAPATSPAAVPPRA